MLHERYESRKPRSPQPPVSACRRAIGAGVAAEWEARSRILSPQVKSSPPAEEKSTCTGGVDPGVAAAEAVIAREAKRATAAKQDAGDVTFSGVEETSSPQDAAIEDAPAEREVKHTSAAEEEE